MKCKYCGKPILILFSYEKNGFYVLNKPKRDGILGEHFCDAPKCKDMFSSYMIEKLYLDPESDMESDGTVSKKQVMDVKA